MSADWLAGGRQLRCYSRMHACYLKVKGDNGQAFEDGLHESLPAQPPGRGIGPMNTDQQFCGCNTGEGLVLPSHSDRRAGRQASTLSRYEDARVGQDGHSRY